MDLNEELGIGDPTNPTPKTNPSNRPKAEPPIKVKAVKPSRQVNMLEDAGIDPTKSLSYSTNQEAMVGNQPHQSHYDSNLGNSGLDQQDTRAANQGWGDKAANSLAKAAGQAGTMLLGTFTSLPWGVAESMYNVAKKKAEGKDIDLQDFKPFVDNPAQAELDKFNAVLEQELPDYASKEEQNSAALSAANVFTPNFLFDKVIKNAGFTVGAILSGKIIGSALGNASKLIASGAYGAEKMAELEALTAAGMELPSALEKVAKTLKIGQHFNTAISTSIMAAGEAQFEGADAKKSLKEKLMQDYLDSHDGVEPPENVLADMEKRATAGGVMTMAINLPILGLSDFVQFGNSLTKGFKVEANAFNKSVAGRIEKGLGVSAAEKWGSRATSFGKGIFTEGSEEGLQTLTQKSTSDYYSRKNDLNAKAGIDDILRSTLYGATELLGSKEGIESMLLGAITGLGSHVVMGAFNGELKEDWNKAANQYDETQGGTTANLIKRLKEHSQVSGLFAKYEGAIRGQSIQESMNSAVENGDVYEYQNLKHDRWKNMVHTYTEAGKLDKLYSKLDELGQLDDTQFQQLFPEADLNRKSVGQYVGKLKEEAKQMSRVWDNVETRFAGSKREEKVQLWENLTNAQNRLKRESELDNKITGFDPTNTNDKTQITSRFITPYAVLLAKHKIDYNSKPEDSKLASERAREEYRKQAITYLTDNSAADFDESDVEEMFKLQDDRANLVNLYQQMKEGKGFAKEESVTKDGVEQTKASVTGDPSELEDNTEEEEPKEGATPISPVVTPIVSKTGLSTIGDHYLRALIKMQKTGATSPKAAGLTDDEKKAFVAGGNRGLEGPTKTNDEDSTAIDAAEALFDKHTKEKTLDQLEALLNNTSAGDAPKDGKGNSKFNIKDIADKIKSGVALTTEEEQYRQNNASDIEARLKSLKSDALSKEFTTLFNKIWIPIKAILDSKDNSKLSKDKTSALNQIAQNQGSLNKLDELLKDIKDSTVTKTLKAQYIKNMQELNTLVNKIKVLAGMPIDVKPVEKKESGFENKRPTRITADPNDTKSVGLRNALASSVDGTMNSVKGLTLSTVMEASVQYTEGVKGGLDHYDVYIGTNKSKTKVGYIEADVSLTKSNIPGNNKLTSLGDFDITSLNLNHEILVKAKKTKFATIKIQFSFARNTVDAANRITLAGSVLANSGGKIYQYKKAGSASTVEDMSATSNADEVQHDVEMEQAFKEAGITDGYILVAKLPDGNRTFIGLKANPISGIDMTALNSAINPKNNKVYDAESLNRKYWLAANRSISKTAFDLRFDEWEGQPSIRVSLNTKGGKNLTHLLIPTGRSFKSIDDLINSLQDGQKDGLRHIASNLEIQDFEIKSLFAKDPLRKQLIPGETTFADYQLSVDGEKPWIVGVQVIEHLTADPKTVEQKTGRKAKTNAKNNIVVDPIVNAAEKVDADSESWMKPFGEDSAVVTNNDADENTFDSPFNENDVIAQMTAKKASQTTTVDTNSPEFLWESGVTSPWEGLNIFDFKAKYGDEITSKYYKGVPFKLAIGDEVVQTNFDKVKKTLSRILPKGISVDSINQLMSGLYVNNQVWAAFSKNVIYFADAIGKGTEYHEAFHAIFRSVFNEQQRTALLEVISPMLDLSTEAIAAFKEMHSSYSLMSDKEAVLRMKEEKLADLFQDYSNNRDDTNFIIQGLKDAFKWLKSFLGFMKGHKDQLDQLFSQIYKGAYRNATLSSANDEIVFKTLPGLTSSTSRDTIRTVIVNMFNKKIEYDKEKTLALIGKISRDPKLGLGIEKLDRNIHESLLQQGKGFAEKIGGVYHYIPAIFAIKYQEQIYKEVIDTIKNFKSEFDPEKVVEDFQDDEDRHVKELAFDEDAFETTMFSAIPEVIKNFLLGIGIDKNKDDMLIPISVLGTHSQLKRMLVGKESYEDMLKEIEIYKKSNPELEAIYGQLSEGKDDFFKANFRNVYLNEYADYMHVSVSQKNMEFSVFAANRQNEAVILVEQYKKGFEALLRKDSKASIKKLASQVLVELAIIDKTKAAKETTINIEPLYSALYAVGIPLTPSLLEQVVKNTQPLDNKNIYYYQHRDSKENPSFRPDIQYIMQAIEKGENPFSDNEDANMYTRLTRLGTVDAKHRNDIFQTSFRNPQGKSMQSFVKPSYELVSGRELVEGSSKLNLSDEKYDGNYLIDRTKELVEDKGGKFKNKFPVPLSVFGGARETRNDEGVTAKLIDTKSKLLVNMIAFSDGFVNVFVHAEKATETFINLNELFPKLKGKKATFGGIQYNPFTKAGVVKDGFNELNESALASYKYTVTRNMRYITETVKELKNPNFKYVEEFHFKVKGNPNAYLEGKPVVFQINEITDISQIPNGLKLIQFPKLQQQAEQIFTAQLEGEKDWMAALEEVTKDDEKLDSFLQDQHQEMVRDYKELLVKEGINFTKEGKLLMGNRSAIYKDNVDHFLSDYVVADFIFVDSYTELIRGNEAKYSGPIDITKRASALIANGNSIHEGDTQFIVEADRFSSFDSKVDGIKAVDDVADSDGQSDCSAKYHIDVLKGLGKLDDKSETTLKEMAQGVNVSRKDIQALLDKGVGTGILKLVGFDGKVYWKTSVFALYPFLTCQLNPETDTYDGTIPKPGMEELNDLRMRMESTGKDVHAFASALKIGIQDKQFYSEEEGYTFTSDNGFSMDNKFIRLQVENPGGKKKITLGTQLLQLIDSEMEEVDENGNSIIISNGDSTISVKEAREKVQDLLSLQTLQLQSKTNALLDGQIQKPNAQGSHSLGIALFADQTKSSGGSESDQDWYKQDVNGKRILSVNTPSKYENFMQQILSYFNKNVLSKKVSGLKMTLRSPVGFVNPSTKEKLKIHRVVSIDGKETIAHAEALISEELLWQYKLYQETDEDGNFQLFKDGDTSKTPLSTQAVDKILTMLGFRIPTQSHHSMIPFKVVGFLPASYTSTIVIPAEVAHLAGSDYDVDSLFVNRKEFYIDTDGEVRIYGELGRINKEDNKSVVAAKLQYQWKEWEHTEENSKEVKFILKKLKVFYPLAENKTKELKAKVKELSSIEYTDEVERAAAIDQINAINLKIKQYAEYKAKRSEDLKKEAFRVLGLPRDFKAWSRSQPQSKYALDNQLLDLYMGFMTNAKNKESVFTPASMSSLKKIGTLINDDFYDNKEESTLPYNSAANRQKHWIANRSNIVGPSANATKVGAFLTKNRVLLKVPITIGSFTSNGYADNYEYDIDLDNRQNTVDQKLSNSKLAPVETFKGYWTRAIVEKDKEKLFLFGDNTDDRSNTKHIPSSTQAQIRGLSNAVGIDTKKNRGTGKNSYFSDSDFEEFKQHVDEVLDKAVATGKTIVVPENGIGTGKAMLAEKAPKLMEYLEAKLAQLKDDSDVEQATKLFVQASKGGLRRRKADGLSSLVSAMTDNAKERLAIKLNLTVDTISVFGNMLALGFGVNRTMLFANQPILRAYSKKVAAGKAHINPEKDRWEISDLMRTKLIEILGGDKALPDTLNFTDEDLLTTTNKNAEKVLAKYNTSKSIKVSDEDRKIIELQYKVISKYIELEKITNYTMTVNRLLNTNKGAGITGEEIDRLKEDQDKFSDSNEQKSFDFPQGAKSIITNLGVVNAQPSIVGGTETKADSNFHYGDVNSVSMRARLAQEFLTRAKPATKIQKNLASFGRLSRKMLKDLKRGYLTSMTVVGINKSLKENPFNGANSLDDLEYLVRSSTTDVTAPWYKKNIVDQYRYIFENYAKEGTALSKNLAFNALIYREASDQNPFFRLEFNTNMKLDSQYKEDLMSDMLELMRYGEGTKNEVNDVAMFAQNLYYMTAVKDGLQYRANSPISLFPPMRFASISKFMEKVTDNIDDPISLYQITGVRKFDFEKNFIHNWLQNPANRKKNSWKQITNKTALFMNNERTELHFVTNTMSKEEFDNIFQEAKYPIKSQKGHITWPLILVSNGLYYARKWYDNDTNQATYEKVVIHPYTPQHSPYTNSINFKKENPVKISDKKSITPQIAEDSLEPEMSQEEAEATAQVQRDEADSQTSPDSNDPDNSSFSDGQNEIPEEDETNWEDLAVKQLGIKIANISVESFDEDDIMAQMKAAKEKKKNC